VIPGNHDKRALMRSAFASRQYLAQSDDFIQYTAEIGPLRLIALDPVVAGEGGGELCRDRLAWLDRQLLHYRSFPVLIVIASPSVSDGNPLHGRRGTTRRPAVRNLGQPLSERGARTLRPCPSHDLAPLRRDHRIELSESGSPVTLDFSPDAEPGFTMEPPGYLLHRWTDSEGITSYSAVIGDYEGPYPFYPNHLGAG
jgi:hypothetical protein